MNIFVLCSLVLYGAVSPYIEATGTYEIKRYEWGALQFGSSQVDTVPMKDNVVIYQLFAHGCTTMTTCAQAIKNLQIKYKRNYSYENLPYNFLIDEVGNIYNGTGWLSSLTQENQYVGDTFDVCLIGTFQDRSRIIDIIDALESLLEYGTKIGIISNNYSLYGLRHDAINPNSIDLYESIKAMPKWRYHPNIVTRRGWEAQQSKGTKYRTEKTAGVMIFHFSTPNCTNMYDCMLTVQALQDYNIDTMNKTDIDYHFIIGEDGYVYEGIGWIGLGAYSTTFKTEVVEICILGDFNEKEPSEKIIDALQDLLEYGEAIGRISKSYVMYSQISRVHNKNLFDAIEALPPWKPIPRICRRICWNSSPPHVPGSLFQDLPCVVFISHTSTSFCYDGSNCKDLIRNIYNREKRTLDFADISYNFLIGDDDTIYTGRGWNIQGEHLNLYHPRSIEIGIIGDYEYLKPAPAAMENLKNFLEFSVIIGKIHPQYVLYDSEQTTTNIRVPKMLREAIKYWPHRHAYPNIISKSVWNASRSIHSQKIYFHTPSYVLLTTVGTSGCVTVIECMSMVKAIQDEQMTNNASNDIIYNFLIGEDGNVYEGLGWNLQGNISSIYNDYSIGICIMGSFKDRLPNSAAINATKDILAFGVATGKLHPSYTLFMEQQLNGSNGSSKLYELIQSWPHWRKANRLQMMTVTQDEREP